VQQKQQEVAKVVNKKEEFEAVRRRIREQYLEKKVSLAHRLDLFDVIW
jgi:hypothetical protein